MNWPNLAPRVVLRPEIVEELPYLWTALPFKDSVGAENTANFNDGQFCLRPESCQIPDVSDCMVSVSCPAACLV
jgi:hypothetical protein